MADQCVHRTCFQGTNYRCEFFDGHDGLHGFSSSAVHECDENDGDRYLQDASLVWHDNGLMLNDDGKVYKGDDVAYDPDEDEEPETEMCGHRSTVHRFFCTLAQGHGGLHLGGTDTVRYGVRATSTAWDNDGTFLQAGKPIAQAPGKQPTAPVDDLGARIAALKGN